MTNHHDFGEDAFAGNFDLSALDPGDFMGPSEATRNAFERTLDTLPFRAENRTQDVEVAHSSDDGYCRVAASISRRFNDTGELSSASIAVYIRDGEYSFSGVAHSMHNLIEAEGVTAWAAIDEILQGLPESDATWLRATWEGFQASRNTRELTPLVVEQLLANSPYEVRERVVETASVRVGTSDTISAQRVVANSAFWEDMAEAGLPTNAIVVEYNGKSYEYSRFADGGEQLLIIGPQYEPRREMPEVTDPTEGLTFSGETSEIIQSLRAAAAREEALRLDLDAVTEGKLKELTAAIQAVQAGAQ